VGGPDHHGAVVGVGAQQPPSDEGIQRGDRRIGQLVAVDLPPSRAALFIDSDQPQQPGNHLFPALAASGYRVSEGRIGLTDQRTLDPTELLVACLGELTTSADAVGELGQGERQQRQRLPAVGVLDQPGHQALVDTDPGQPGRLFDHNLQRLAAQRPQHIGARRQCGGFGVAQQLVEELWAQRTHQLYRTGQRRAQQLDKPSPLGRRGLGEQLLELVHHDQQAPLRTARGGQQQFAHQPRQAGLVELVAHVLHRPVQVDLSCCHGQSPGQRRHRIDARYDRRQRPPARLSSHHRRQPGPHQRRLPAPRRTHHQQRRTLGTLSRGS